MLAVLDHAADLLVAKHCLKLMVARTIASESCVPRYGGPDGRAAFRAANFMAPVKRGNENCSSLNLKQFKTKMAAGEPAVFLGNICWINGTS